MDTDLKELLGWLVFTKEESYLLETEGFNDFEDFVSTTKDELNSMIDGFYKWNYLAFTIPINRRKLLYMVYWSDAVISTAAVCRQGSTGRVNKSLMGLPLLLLC